MKSLKPNREDFVLLYKKSSQLRFNNTTDQYLQQTLRSKLNLAPKDLKKNILNLGQRDEKKMFSGIYHLNHECEISTISRGNNKKRSSLRELLPVGTEPSLVSKQAECRGKENWKEN